MAGFLNAIPTELKAFSRRYCRLLFVFGVLVVILPFTNFAPELTNSAADSFSDVSYASRAE